MNAQKLFEHLQLLDETERIEAKTGREAGRSILETICAFANEPNLGGGWLLLGVASDEEAPFPGYVVVGVDNPGKLGSDLASQAAGMFNLPLRRCYPMLRVDYIRVPGRDWVPDPENRFETLDLRASLFRLIRRVTAAILDDLPKAFGLDEGELQRTDSPLVPQRVIREAVVNALMHRSYRVHAPVQIIRYSNRLEIRNPGFSLKSPEHLGEPGSVLRNPRIAAALYDARFAETKGSGVRVMRETCEQAGLAPPLFESDRGRDQFALRLFFHHFLGTADRDWLASFKALHLSEADARALVVARELGAMDNHTYREINKVDTLTASQALKHLRDRGLFEQKGRGPATWYKPTARMLGEGGEAPHPNTRPGAHASLSSNPSPLSGNLLPLSGNLEGERRRALLNTLPGALAARAGTIGQRHPPQKVQELVVDLCRLRAWRAEELGCLLARNPETVRQSYLRPLLRAGRIRMTNPEKPHDPEQAYISGGNE